jgi:hypothetical protein
MEFVDVCDDTTTVDWDDGEVGCVRWPYGSYWPPHEAPSSCGSAGAGTAGLDWFSVACCCGGRGGGLGTVDWPAPLSSTEFRLSTNHRLTFSANPFLNLKRLTSASSFKFRTSDSSS